MKEKVLEALSELGFAVEDYGSDCIYSFKFEGINFLYVHNNEDEDFLSLAIPGIYDIEEEENLLAYQAMDAINAKLKYVKANKYENSIWLFYEREIMGEEDVKFALGRMIAHLENAYRQFHCAAESDGEAAEADSESE